MELLHLLERFFASSEEPGGGRVNTYHKPKRIESINDALDPQEVEFLHNTTFGNIISQAKEEDPDTPPSPPKTMRYYNPTHVRELDGEAKVSKILKP